MYKKVFLSLLFVSSLYSYEKYTMYASTVESMGDKVYATGSVVIYHEGKVYKCQQAVYDKAKRLLVLKEDVTIIDKKSVTKSDILKIHLNKKISSSEKFFIYDSDEGLWLRGSKYKGENDIFIVKNSEVSSCDVQKPDWKILFKKAKYNKKKEFLSLYNPTFYFKNKPVFALPWFAFPTIRSRTTGLLRPTFGMKVDSGFVYMQPYFYAPKKNWDLEITPQIRTNRGAGLYTTFSFADTPFSKGEITFGSFFDKKSFFYEKNLKNNSHYGFNITYTSHRFFDKYLKKNSYKDGLWLDLHYLNDIDYENLKDINIKSLNKLVTSRFNYYLKRNSDYLGLYAKYFIDTDKPSNDDTLQVLPNFQYHRFATTLPFKNLIYSVDYKVKNDYRKDGLNAVMHEINFPLKIDFSLFSNYLNFSISENLYFTKIDYKNKKSLIIKDVTYFSNYHKFVLNSDLIKPYKDFIHNIQLEASLQVPSFEDKEGDIADFISINKEEKNLKLSINQYFYDYNDFEFLTLRTKQLVYLDRKDNKYSDIFNEIIYRYSNKLTLHEDFDYSTKYHKIKKLQSTIDYKDDIYKFSLSHTYESIPSVKKVNYLTSNFKLKLSKGFEFEGELDYDIEKKSTRSWGLKLFRDKKCWDYSIKYKESITPIFTSAGAKSYKNKGLYFLVNFANIGGISYEYSQDDVSDTGDR